MYGYLDYHPHCNFVGVLRMICAERTGTLDDLTGDVLEFHPAPRPRGRKKKNSPTYAREVLAFDIEVSSLPEYKQGLIYHWQLQIGDKITITGRYASEIKTAFQRVSQALGIKELTAICWVHNLAYEFQFLTGIVPITDVFATDIRSPLRCKVGNVELRCSYLQSGVSLQKLTSTYKVAHPKAAGDLDYRVVRYPWTPLTDEERTYCLNDVRGLVEAMEARREERGDSLYTMPFTKTGYIRRQVKGVLKGPFTLRAREMQSDYTVYQALRRAFRGGNTHANRFYVGQIVGPAYEWDRSSSYPDVMVNCRMPSGDFKEIAPEKFWEYYESSKWACLADVRLANIRLRDDLWPVPYVSQDKSRYVRGAVYDNGRILSADYLEITVTDIDLQIILDEYSCDVIVDRCWVCRYKPLPPAFTDIVKRLYHNKTALKGVAGRESDYALSKEDINSCYGMTVQDPGKPNICFRRCVGVRRYTARRAVPKPHKKHPASLRVGCVDYRMG